MADRVLTGDWALDKTLSYLGAAVANRVARATLGACNRAVVQKMKAFVPRHARAISRQETARKALRKGNATIKQFADLKSREKTLLKAIGGRLEVSAAKDLSLSKAGINVGKQTKAKLGKRAPHAHLVALGTKRRARKKIGGHFSWIKYPTDAQLNSGTMPKNDFIKQAYAAAKGNMSRVALTAATQKLRKEVAKLKSK